MPKYFYFKNFYVEAAFRVPIGGILIHSIKTTPLKFDVEFMVSVEVLQNARTVKMATVNDFEYENL